MSTSNKSGGCGQCQRKYPCSGNQNKIKSLNFTVGPLVWVTGYGPNEPIADKPFVDPNAYIKDIKALTEFLKLSCLNNLDDNELFAVYQELHRVLTAKLYDLEMNGTLTPPPDGECQFVSLSNIKVKVTTENCNPPSGRPRPPSTSVEASFDINISTRPCN